MAVQKSSIPFIPAVPLKSHKNILMWYYQLGALRVPPFGYNILLYFVSVYVTRILCVHYLSIISW